MAASSSSLSDSSLSSSHRRKRRLRRHRDRDVPNVRKEKRSHIKRRHNRPLSSSDRGRCSSYSSSDYCSSSDSDHESSEHHKKRKHKDTSSKKKDKEKGKRHKSKHQKHNTKEKQERCSSPVQLSKFLGRDKDDGVRRSAVSGKKILLKLDKTKEDKEAENKRNELLRFLNASYD
ncbi:unnamed protein product [Cuscuta europaea]|uniref:Uncharacterized protein n=1 Tax=Cuscuta europaea TaxID=41803 RepID=A0A9P0ZDJ8_CUSEU|nr:unnamed protein product [Cuscuta europaea]